MDLRDNMVKRQRLRLGMTQEQLGKALCMSARQIMRYEQGQAEPKEIFYRALDELIKKQKQTGTKKNG